MQCFEGSIVSLEVAEYLHQHLKNSKLVVMKATGYYLQLSYKDENVPFGYFVLDISGLIEDANLTFLTWLSYERKEWIGTNIEESLAVSSKN